MFFWRYFGLVGYVFVGIIYCQDNDLLLPDIDQPNEPDFQVHLSIDTQPKSSQEAGDTASMKSQKSEEFACHECTDCNLKSAFTTRVCESGINMCYKIHKNIDDKNQVIRRGCTTLRNQCTVPNDDQSNLIDSITCCYSPKCNQGIQSNPLFSLFIITLFTTIINII